MGLEIKRELLVGRLSTIRQAMLPVMAAIGGMVSSLSAGVPGYIVIGLFERMRNKNKSKYLCRSMHSLSKNS